MNQPNANLIYHGVGRNKSFQGGTGENLNDKREDALFVLYSL